VDVLTSLGRTMGFSFAAGINLYATVAILGLASRYGWVALPPQYQVFDNNWIIGGALALYVVALLLITFTSDDNLDEVLAAQRPALEESSQARISNHTED